MADYHVGAGCFGIYAGTLNKKGNLWQLPVPPYSSSSLRKLLISFPRCFVPMLDKSPHSPKKIKELSFYDYETILETFQKCHDDICYCLKKLPIVASVPQARGIISGVNRVVSNIKFNPFVIVVPIHICIIR